MILNPNYIEMLQQTFSDEIVSSIIAAYDLEPIRGIRLNPFKPSLNSLNGQISKLYDSVLIPDSYKEAVVHPNNHAGVYYLQDPSATLPVRALQLNNNDIVLDMCAAPGGKTTQILSEVPGGFCIANEIDRKRNRRLVANVDRWGIENCVVTQMDTSSLSRELENCFDKVLCDVPCSGEGMYRKNQDFALEYSQQTAYTLSVLQSEILENAYKCVCDGGYIVYSTCTLNTIENERVILSFLNEHPECKLVPLNFENSSPGLLNLDADVTRYYPSEHGEGHFIARIHVFKNNNVVKRNLKFKDFRPRLFDCEDRKITCDTTTINDEVFGLKKRGFINENLNITRDGVHVGTLKKNRFEYSHALSQSVNFDEDFQAVEVSITDAYRYLYGHTIESSLKGIHKVKYLGNTLGFIKGNGKTGNNKYPKHLRNKFDTYNFNC